MNESQLRTKVTEKLEGLGAPYRALPHARAVLTCEEAAAERGVPLKEMIKCLVFLSQDSKAVVMACVPGDRRLSLKKLKTYARTKKLSALSDEELLHLVTFPRGSIPPLALPPSVAIVADKSIQNLRKLNISSGLPIAGIEISQATWRQAFTGNYADLLEDT